MASYLRPGFVVRKVLNPIAKLFGTTLAVRGRRSGEWRTVPVNVLEHDGARYLVAPRGETEWVRNLRVAGGGEIRRRRRREAFTATEIPTEQRKPIIDAYLAKWGKAVGSQFKALPDAADHPTFRIAAA